MRFLLRHPVLIMFVLGFLVLSYTVYDTVSQPGAGGPGPGGPMMGRGGPGGAGGVTPVHVEVVSRQLFADKVESVGTASAMESIDLTAKVTDTVRKVHFSDGAFVEQGDLLVELTNTAEAARLAEARASAEEAVRQYERLRNLMQTNLISVTDLEEARTRAETAQARLEGVMANMDDRLIRAPFSGVLGLRNISEGTLVSPNTVITTLDDVSVIKLDFTVAEAYLAQLQRGQSIDARSIVYRDRDFKGTVEVVGSRIDPVTRSVSVRAHIDNSEGALRPGMLLTVGLTLNEEEVVVVPEQAVVPSQGRHYVFVVDEENIAREVEVEVGRRRPGLVEIVAGVMPGQRVVTLGVGQVRPHQPVRVMNTVMSVPELAKPSEHGQTEQNGRPRRS